MTHLLDTSAILAHCVDEPGADEVGSLLAQGPAVVALAAPSWVELDTRLRELVSEVEERENVFLQYTTSLTTLVPVDAESCIAAIRLRNATPGRLPLADALTAELTTANRNTSILPFAFFGLYFLLAGFGGFQAFLL